MPLHLISLTDFLSFGWHLKEFMITVSLDVTPRSVRQVPMFQRNLLVPIDQAENIQDPNLHITKPAVLYSLQRFRGQ